MIDFLVALVVVEALAFILAVVIANQCIDDENAWRVEVDRLHRRLRAYENLDEATSTARQELRKFWR